MKQTEREPLLTDVAFMIGGVLIIAVAYVQKFNAIEFLPGDNRGEPWFHPAVAILLTIGGLFALLVGSIRFLQGLRGRRK